jgi:hypothetical protein
MSNQFDLQIRNPFYKSRRPLMCDNIENFLGSFITLKANHSVITIKQNSYFNWFSWSSGNYFTLM